MLTHSSRLQPTEHCYLLFGVNSKQTCCSTTATQLCTDKEYVALHRYRSVLMHGMGRSVTRSKMCMVVC